MKVYEVTTVSINLETLEKQTTTTIRREDEMGCFKKPRVLFKTIVDWSYSNSKENTFNNATITRIR